MEDMLLEFENGIADMLEIFNKFRDSIGDNPVSKSTRQYIERFIEALKNYNVVLDKGSIEEIAEATSSVCSSANTIKVFVNDVDQQTKSYIKDLSDRAKELEKKIENSSILKVTLTDKALSNISNDMQDYRSFKKKLKDTNEKLEELNRTIKKSLDESEIKANTLTKEIESLESIYDSKIKSISVAYEEELKAINDKNAQLDQLLGNAASRVIVSEYADSAKQEKIAAEWLRGGSIFCMAVIIVEPFLKTV